MKMPFEGLSLLDYAINASLVLLNVALLKEDKAGLITVSEKIGSIVPADKRPAHINKILEVLYKEKNTVPGNQYGVAVYNGKAGYKTAQPGCVFHQL